MGREAKLIVALDVETFEEASQLIDRLQDTVGIYKVGSQLFTACGPMIVRYVLAKGKQVFLDLKFHDIPNTVPMPSPPLWTWPGRYTKRWMSGRIPCRSPITCYCVPCTPRAGRRCLPGRRKQRPNRLKSMGLQRLCWWGLRS